MDNNLTSDYKIILIDSSNVFYNNGNNNFDFHINFLDPLRDVYKIKILYDAVSFNTNKLISNTSNLDIIYVNLNGFDRVRTSIIDPVKKDINELYYFDSIMIDKNKIKINQGVNDTTMFNDFNENEGDYYLKPIASQFNRINIELRNKNNDLITKDYIDRFVMKICIYYNIKKISQF
jgi:hypothetical protein